MNMHQISCQAMMIAAPASGSGKTTLTAALAAWHRRQGRRVSVFKIGPDFLDPFILERASGRPVHQLDLWMCGETHCQALLYRAARESDLILVEGMMGLFDGQPSAADLAVRFRLPVVALIDAGAMAQTFGAVALGLARYRDDLELGGVVANRSAGDGHSRMLADSMPAGVAFLGALPNDPAIHLPERHLGLHQAGEIADLDQRLTAAAEQLASLPLAGYLPEVSFSAVEQPAIEPALKGIRIGIARDAAFCFLYAANVDTLTALGAELVYFSPLADSRLPEVDALYFPGGYPELHGRTLANNGLMKDAIRAHHRKGKPIFAECGGMLYLAEQLRDLEQAEHAMVGLLPGQVTLFNQLQAIGAQEVTLPEGTLRGHTYHYSRFATGLEPIAQGRYPSVDLPGEAVYRQGRLTASYCHLYFASNPIVSKELFLS